MSQFSLGYILYLLLYSVFWTALAVIVYRALVVAGPLDLSAGPYFFWTGLVLLVGAYFRMMRLKTLAIRKHRCPIVGSLNLNGLLLIVVANFI